MRWRSFSLKHSFVIRISSSKLSCRSCNVLTKKKLFSEETYTELSKAINLSVDALVYQLLPFTIWELVSDSAGDTTCPYVADSGVVGPVAGGRLSWDIWSVESSPVSIETMYNVFYSKNHLS